MYAAATHARTNTGADATHARANRRAHTRANARADARADAVLPPGPCARARWVGPRSVDAVQRLPPVQGGHTFRLAPSRGGSGRALARVRALPRGQVRGPPRCKRALRAMREREVWGGREQHGGVHCCVRRGALRAGGVHRCRLRRLVRGGTLERCWSGERRLHGVPGRALWQRRLERIELRRRLRRGAMGPRGGDDANVRWELRARPLRRPWRNEPQLRREVSAGALPTGGGGKGPRRHMRRLPVRVCATSQRCHQLQALRGGAVRPQIDARGTVPGVPPGDVLEAWAVCSVHAAATNAMAHTLANTADRSTLALSLARALQLPDARAHSGAHARLWRHPAAEQRRHRQHHG